MSTDPPGSCAFRSTTARGCVRGANVIIRADSGILEGKTNARGNLVMKIPRAGRFSVMAEAPGHSPWLGESEVGEEGGTLEIVLVRSSSLSGRVRGYWGEGPSLRVTAISVENEGQIETAEISPAGEFRFASLHPGAYEVGLSPGAFRQQAVQIHLEPGEHGNVELSLPETGRIAVKATFASKGSLPRR